MVAEMVTTISTLIEENYVLKAQGELIAATLRKDFSQGRFSKAQNLKQLDSTLTKSLRESSNDYHLYTWNNKKIVDQLQAASSEEKETSGAKSFFNDEAAYDANFGFKKIEILEGNIGYIELTQINISDVSLNTLYSAMTMVHNTNALVIDLRSNSGGGSTIGPVLETFFLETPTDLLEFRSRNGETKIERTVGWLVQERYNRPLYLLTSKGTASAAEAFAFSLKNQNRCVIVGEPSYGGAYMNTYFPVNENFVVAISTDAPFLPGTNESWEGTGVTPDHETTAPEALKKAIELISADLK